MTGGKQNETIDQLLERVKYDAQLWHDLLWASGGKLELQKCGFHLIFYDFNKHGVPSMRKISDLVIILENEKGEDIEIRTIFFVLISMSSPFSFSKIMTKSLIFLINGTP